jgi:hypothetical protein
MPQWGAFVLDRLVAPKCSELTTCHAPELPEAYDYFVSFFLNNVLISTYPDKTRWPTVVFLRRLTNAAQAYRNGREQMLKCIAVQQHSNEMVRAYLNSLSAFESAIVNAYLALMAHEAVGKLINPTAAASRSFNPRDGSPAQKLNVAYNALKHYHGNIEEGTITNGAPVWLVADGIECVGSEGDAKLFFEELAQVLRDLDVDAKFLAEDVYRMASEAANSRPD